jgi:polyhydroxyalkanoate synthesis regulator phasin
MGQQSDTAPAGDQQKRSGVNPLELVVITRARLQEVVDEAVSRGRLTRGDAADLVSDLIARGRSGASELEQLIARRPLEAARRVAGLGQELAIEDYDDLTAAQVVAELDELSPRDLRRVREYERANANRKTVLGAIERKLG